MVYKKYIFKIGGIEFQGDNEEEIFKNVEKYFQTRQTVLDVVFVKKMISENKKESNTIASRIRNSVKREKLYFENLTFQEATDGVRAILKNSAGFTASQEEVTRRSIICTSCPKASDFSGCAGCGAAEKIQSGVNAFKKSIGMKTLEYPNNIHKHFCQHCGCSLHVMLATKKDAFKVSDHGISNKRPPFCWLNPESNNFTKE